MLAASIGEMVQDFSEDINASFRGYSVYGIVFSIFYRSIVRLDVNSEGLITIQHTPVLPFLPSPHTDDRTTAGITALVRLVSNLSRATIVQYAIEVMKGLPLIHKPYENPFYARVSHTILSKLPVEICSEIIKHLINIGDILTFSRLSYNCEQAASRALRYPRISIRGHHCTLYRDTWRIRPTDAQPGTRGADEPLKIEDELKKMSLVFPKDLTCGVFRGTHPVEGECFIALDVSTRAVEPLHMRTVSFFFLEERRDFKIHFYKIEEKSIDAFGDPIAEK